MSQRDRECDCDRDDPLAQLVAIEAPEFLDALVLGQARALLEASQASKVTRVEALAAQPRQLALFARMLPPRLKSS